MRATLAVVLFAAGAPCVQSEVFELRPAPGTQFALTVEKTGLWSGKKHVFDFQRYSGVLRFNRPIPAQSQVELTIEAGSAVCNDTWLDEKDRKKVLAFLFHEMLDIERHPRLMFRSTSVVPNGANAFEVSGILTVRGIERPAKVTVTVEESGNTIAAIAGRSIVRLTDYGLKPPKAALGAIGTKNEMKVEFRLAPRPAGSATLRL